MSRRLLRRLIHPGVPEPSSREHLVRLSRLTVGLSLGLSTLNLVIWLLSLSQPEYDRGAMGRFVALVIAAHVGNGALNQWAISSQWAVARHRRVAYPTVILFLAAAALAFWAFGSLTNYFTALRVMWLVAIVRVVSDSRIGLFAVAAAVAMHVGLVALEIAGVLTSHAAISGHFDPLYERPRTMIMMVLMYAGTYVTAWVGASYVALRYRDSEHALRLAADSADRLRDQLGRLGKDGGQARRGRLTGARLVGRYDVGELLGQGGMGEVYQARTVETGRDVAIKVLHPHLGDAPRALLRFRREVELAARIPPAHVAEVLDFGVTEGAGAEPFLVMEFLRGQDLGALLRRRELTRVELVALVDRIATALEAAHAAGVVHRDLKPQNIFLLEGLVPTIRLLDFGVARLLEEASSLTQSAFILGTPGFLAPEQVRGDAEALGPHTDVFALGAIIYRALTGTMAFPARDTASAVYEALHVMPTPPSRIVPSLPTDVDVVLALALAKDPKERYARPLELARDLGLALCGQLPETTRLRAGAHPPPEAPTRT